MDLQNKSNHVTIEYHADDYAGKQSPRHFTDKLNVGLFLRVTGGQGADGVSEQVEIGRANGVVTNKQEEEIIPVCLA